MGSTELTAGAFTTATRVAIIEREAGHCARCGGPVSGGQVHHRRPRGMGGDRRHATSGAANGLHVCPVCHAWIERNRAAALEVGWLVPAELDPATVPVLYSGGWFAGYPKRVLLDDDGSINAV